VLAVAAVLILAVLGAYWNSFNVPPLLDDSVSFSDNSSIRHLGRVVDVLSPPSTGTTAARPLLNLTFALNYAWGGLSVQGYHAVNLLIHIGAGLALLGVVRRTLLLPPLRHRYGEAALPLAAFVALLWTLHPLQTESITYISQRAESLMGLFYLLTLYCFIRAVPSIAASDLTKGNEGNAARESVHGSLFSSLPSVKTAALEIVNPCVAGTGWLFLSVAACFCGMATKQVMVTAPVLMLLYDRAFVSGSFRSALANRRWYYVGLAATWLLLGFLMHRSSLAADSVGFQAGVSWPTYALTELRVVTDYLKLAVWPHPLVFDYGTEILVTHPLTVVPYALIVVAILIGVVIAWRRSPMAGFLGAWFFLILAPTSTVVPIAEQPMAESRVYLPLAGVIVLVTLLSYALGQRRAFVVLGLVATGLGVLTVRRNHDYRSELSIWEDTVARYPHASRGYCTLGVVFAKMPGRLAEAIAHYETALRLKPDYAEAHSYLANALAATPGRSAEAIAHYETALRLKPGLAEAHSNLAVELAKIPGRLAEAIAHYEAALRLKPDFVEAHNNLANELVKLPGRSTDAIAHYEAALRLKPDLAEAHINLANVLAERPGRLTDAIAHYETAVRLKPNSSEIHYNLAIALAQIPGRLSDAIAHYEVASRLKPDSAEAHNNLANVLGESPGRSTDAIAHYVAALRLKPDFAEAHYNLAVELAKIPGRLTDAIVHYETAVRLKPDLVEAHNNLAAVYVETGRLEAAIGQLEIAARLDPASTVFRDNLEKLRARRKQ
jgi:tetratricopeptide (TPR) repeat protein